MTGLALLVAFAACTGEPLKGDDSQTQDSYRCPGSSARGVVTPPKGTALERGAVWLENLVDGSGFTEELASDGAWSFGPWIGDFTSEAYIHMTDAEGDEFTCRQEGPRFYLDCDDVVVNIDVLAESCKLSTK